MFDAAAALIGLCDTAGYEAQGAIRLEAAAAPAADVLQCYPFLVHDGEHPWVVDLGPAFRALVGEIRRGVPVGTMAAKFHNTVVAASAATVARLCAEREVTDVVLSGGVFQNRLVLTGLTAALSAEGLTVHANSLTPCNDGGLSLGQAAVALARIGRGARSRAEETTDSQGDAACA